MGGGGKWHWDLPGLPSFYIWVRFLNAYCQSICHLINSKPCFFHCWWLSNNLPMNWRSKFLQFFLNLLKSFKFPNHLCDCSLPSRCRGWRWGQRRQWKRPAGRWGRCTTTSWAWERCWSRSGLRRRGGCCPRRPGRRQSSETRWTASAACPPPPSQYLSCQKKKTLPPPSKHPDPFEEQLIMTQREC